MLCSSLKSDQYKHSCFVEAVLDWKSVLLDMVVSGIFNPTSAGSLAEFVTSSP